MVEIRTACPYCKVDLEGLLTYARAFDVECGGRYSLAVISGFEEYEDASALRAHVWTHPWSTPDMKDESTQICAFEFNRPLSSMVGILVCPNFDITAAWEELLILEEHALGRGVHGRRRPVMGP